MPPKRQIHTCPDTVLRQLAISMTDLINELARTLDLAGWYGGGSDPCGPLGNKAHYWNELKSLRSGWHRFNCVELSGKDSLTESERVRWRQQCRRMEADGLLRISGDGRANHIGFTQAGLERLSQLPDGPEMVDKLEEALAQSNPQKRGENV